MLQRSSFKRPKLERAPTVHTPVPAHLRRSASFARADGGHEAAPKPEVHRNAALMEMARGRRCLFRFPGICRGNDTDTTVACHSNLSEHGKAGARKANDEYSVWGCFACHQMFDQGHLTEDERRAVFVVAHVRQVQEWSWIAHDPTEKPRFRRAADWALNLLMGK